MVSWAWSTYRHVLFTFIPYLMFLNLFTNASWVLQALVALSEVIKQITKENPDFYNIKPTGYDRFLVLSLGTGSAKNEHKYNAKKASKWGVIEWLYNGGSSPLIEVYTQGSSDMVDYYNCAAFEALGRQDNFIRIQVSFNFLFQVI